LSVGDKATPAQIMKHFGVEKYNDSEAEWAKAQNAPDYWEHMEKVGPSNAAEEIFWKMGPSCDKKSCEIPYGVTVGSGASPIDVLVFISFDKTGTIELIDISFDSTQWDDVLALLNTKYGDGWRTEESPMMVGKYGAKESLEFTVTELRHRTPGTNSKTGDTCTLYARNIDKIWEHSTSPIYRGFLEIKRVSKNF